MKQNVATGTKLISNRERLAKELSDPEYRRAFVEGHAKDTVAFQLKHMRKSREWEQRDLAKAAFGDPSLQPMVSRYENPDYGKFSISTLLQLAAAFDVALIVRFAPYSELLEWDVNCKDADMSPPDYEHDTALHGFQTTTQQRSSNAGLSVNTFEDAGNVLFATQQIQLGVGSQNSSGYVMQSGFYDVPYIADPSPIFPDATLLRVYEGTMMGNSYQEIHGTQRLPKQGEHLHG